MYIVDCMVVSKCEDCYAIVDIVLGCTTAELLLQIACPEGKKSTTRLDHLERELLFFRTLTQVDLLSAACELTSCYRLKALWTWPCVQSSEYNSPGRCQDRPTCSKPRTS